MPRTSVVLWKAQALPCGAHLVFDSQTASPLAASVVLSPAFCVPLPAHVPSIASHTSSVLSPAAV